MMKDVETRLSYQGMNMETYLKMMGKTMEELRNDCKDEAESSVKTKIILEQIIKEEKIEPSQEKINEKIAELSKIYGKTEEELKQNEAFVEYVTKNLQNDLVVEFLVDNAKIK